MLLKIAVCDDEPIALKQIEQYLLQIQQETEHLQFSIFFFSDAEDLLAHMPRDIQLLLLDIRMPGSSGIETARKLRKEGLDFYLFFITSNTQYALDGYSVHAYAFLSKPLQYTHLKTHLLEVAARIQKTSPALVSLKDGASSHVVDFTEVVYTEVFGHTSVIVFENSPSLKLKISLDELEKFTANHSFFRCHKSYLINLRKVKSIRPAEIIMSNGDVIPLSRNRKQDFLLAFHEAIDF